MRIEGIGYDLASLLAAQTYYVDLKGLTGTVVASSLDNNTGVRFLRENQWRGLDLHEVLRQLNVSQNKLLILRLLQRSDLFEIIALLDKSLLINGLRFFSKEKLLRLMLLLPKELLLKMLLHLMPLEDLFAKMPTHELFAILRSHKLDVRHLVKGFQCFMEPKFLHFILGKITDRDVSHLTMREMLDIFMKLNKRTILEGMRFLPFKALTPFVLGLTQQDPALLLHLSLAFIFKLFDRMTKPTMIEAFHVVDDALILKFLAQLPDKFLLQVAAQIDDATLEKYLLSRQPQLLTLLAGGDTLAA